MSKSKFLGEFEILVLAALLHVGKDAYGVSIMNEIKERANRSVSIGALYATLSRLEEKNYVSSTMGEATAERGGRAKRYYKITPSGQAQLKRSTHMLHSMLTGIPGWEPKTAS